MKKPSSRIRIVCFGGGTGLSSLLSGLRGNQFFDITAIVSMFDNGRSSGELRDRFGVLPPGDIMKCMVALAQYPDVVREMLNKRVVREGRAPHSAGNMLLMGIEKVYGDYYEAIRVFSELLAIQGRVIPVALAPSTLYGELVDGTVVDGQVAVARALAGSQAIKRVFLAPEVKACSFARAALRAADLIVVGPGSLYESILPNFLPIGIREELLRSKAPMIYVQNLLTEGLAMQHTTSPLEWVKTVEQYIGRRFSKILINNAKPEPRTLMAYTREGKHPILWSSRFTDRRLVPQPLWCDQSIARHDPVALNTALTELALKLCR